MSVFLRAAVIILKTRRCEGEVSSFLMRRLLVYPFSYESLPLARYFESLEGYSKVIPVIEKRVGIPDGVDVAYLDGGAPTGLVVVSDFERAVQSVDDVLFTAEIRDEACFAVNFSMAKRLGKRILVCGDFSKRGGLDFKDCQVLSHSKRETEVDPTHRLRKIPVPVVLVTGLGQQCQKFDIQMCLRRKFQEADYNVSQVGTKPFSSLFGFHALPHFPDTPLWKKIVLYNRYFKDVVDSEDPDMLIVGAPGGVMPIDDRHSELFGETAIAISKSLSPDVAIVSVFQAKLDGELLDGLGEMRNYFKYAMGSPLDYIHLSNTRQVFESDLRSISYMVTDSSRVFEGQEAVGDSFFNAFLADTVNTVSEKIMSRLQGNLEVF